MPSSEDYEAHLNTIHSTILRFLRRYGYGWEGKVQLDWDDLEEIASEGFLKAWNTYIPSKGTFSHWIDYQVFKALQDHLLEIIKKHKRLPVERGELQETPDKEAQTFSLRQFIGKLSADSQVTIWLVIECPPQVEKLMESQNPTPSVWKRAIREVLGELGWDEARIQETFQEIREALQKRKEV